MTRVVEVFSAGCHCCVRVIEDVRSMLGPSGEMRVLSMSDPLVADRARELGVTRVPSVAVDGRLLDCCRSPGISAETLRRAGVGAPQEPITPSLQAKSAGRRR